MSMDRMRQLHEALEDLASTAPQDGNLEGVGGGHEGRIEQHHTQLDELAEADPEAYANLLEQLSRERLGSTDAALESVGGINSWSDDRVRAFASQLGIPTAGEPDAPIRPLRNGARNESKKRPDAQPIDGDQWFNCVGQRGGPVKQRLQPESLGQLLRWLRGQRLSSTIRVVGGGHSSADVVNVAPDTLLVDLSRMISLGPNPPADWRGDHRADLQPPPGAQLLLRIPVGLSLRQLNTLLDRSWEDDSEIPDDSDILDPLNPHLRPMPPAAFSNLGGYDAQSFWGACATGTHGSGRGLPALPGMVASCELIVLEKADDGTLAPQMVQVEGAGPRAITDPARFAANPQKQGWKLIQDDQALDALTLGLGRMGIVVSAQIWAQRRYGLAEESENSWWSELRETVLDELAKPDVRHFQFLIAGFPRNRIGRGPDRRVVLTRRRRFDPVPMKARYREERAVPETLKLLMPLGPTFFDNCTGSMGFNGARNFAHTAIRSAKWKDRDGLSYAMLKLGAGGHATLIASEFFVPASRVVDAVDLMNRTIDAYHEELRDAPEPRRWQLSPVGIRFIARSTALLLPHLPAGETHYASIEIPANRNLDDSYPSLRRHIAAFAASDIPFTLHWGQWSGRPGIVSDALIPQSAIDSWEQQRRRFDPHEVMKPPRRGL